MKVGAAASVVLLAAASAFYWLARDTESEAYRAAADAIRQVRLLATEWSVETARARTDPMGDYDALAAFIPEVARLKEAILGTVRETAMPERLANEVYAFASALDAKEERVERFKTANSVIRNSVRYLPHAATGIAQSAADAELVQDVTTLADGLAEYAASPTDAAKGRLAAIRDRLVERQEALSGDLGRRRREVPRARGDTPGATGTHGADLPASHIERRLAPRQRPGGGVRGAVGEPGTARRTCSPTAFGRLRSRCSWCGSS